MLGDAAELGRVMVTSWLSAHEGQIPEEAWRRRAAEWTPEVSAQGWARVLVGRADGNGPHDVLLVADDHAGQLVGLVYGRTTEDDDPASTAEVRALYVAPTCRRQGIGAALLRAAARELDELGFSTFRLEVLSANLEARAFYEDMGGREVRQGDVRRGGPSASRDGLRMGERLPGWLCAMAQ